MDATWTDSVRLARHASRSPRHTARDDIRYIALAGAQLRARVTGAGPFTLVMTPDPPNVIEHYDQLIRLLSPRLRVVCVELPGFGFSSPTAAFRFTLAEGAQLVAELLRLLDMRPYVLALSCVAGLVALKVAHDEPELVARVVTIQTPSWDEELRWAKRLDVKGLIATPYVGQALVALRRRAIAGAWYRAALGDVNAAPKYLETALGAFAAGAHFCLASLFQALRRSSDDLAPASLTAAQRALCVFGGADRTHRRTNKRSILTHLPAGTITQIDAAGHFPDLEEPALFRDALLRFLELERAA